MATAPPERSVPFNLDLVFRPGMGRRLLICILTSAILPILLIGWINYRAARSHMEQDIHKTIRLYAELKSQQINAYLQSHIVDSEQLGHEPTTIAFFNALLRRRTESEAPLSDFIFSPAWNTVVSAYGSGIQLHADIHGYHDILMIDTDGQVIYANAQQRDLAGYLNIADMTAAIHNAFRETLATGKPVFSGFESGVSEDTGVQAFITAAIGGVGNPPVGVIVLKIPGSDIQQVINMPPEPEADVRMYLIDRDLTLLAGTIDGQRPDTRLTIKTAIARRWHDAAASNPSALPPLALVDYQDPSGHWIVGTYASIQAGAPPHALVVEVDRTMAFSAIERQQKLFFAILILTALSIIAIGVILARTLIEPVQDLTENMTLATHGHVDEANVVFASHELGRLAVACNDLINHVRALTAEHEFQSRLVAGMASLHRLLGGAQKSSELCLKTLEFLSDFLDIDQADFYIDDNGRFVWACHYPGQPDGDNGGGSCLGKGCMDEAAVEKTMLVYRKDETEALMTAVPTVDLGNLVAVPLVLQETVIGGLKVQKTSVFSLFEGHFLQVAAEFIAIALGASLTREKEQSLLERTRQQAGQLKLRETDLEAKTRELESQGQAFQESEKVLQLKHLELEAANAQMAKNAADLEANMAILEQQKRDMQKQNAELEKAHRELADKARQLEISSQYKTEFMANMSHELRTPLNSILLLSRLLLENKSNTLTAKQAEFAQTIYSAGEDLLNLINEILDLAKVESGKIEVESAPVAIQSIVKAMQGSFSPLAEQSGINFSTHVDEDVPRQLISDRKRIEQIVKNFLSNAFKFTFRGSIGLAFTTSTRPVIGHVPGSTDESDWLSISVTDTGIGIPKAKQEMVFDAFQQVDGSTRRKYGGTGLGLSISRELARMLGGEITLDSEEGKGSRFTLHLPIVKTPAEEPQMIRNGSVRAAPPASPSSPPDEEEASHQIGHGLVPDDRHRLTPGNPCILIVDADLETSETIMTIAHDHGYKVVVAEQRMTGLHFADYYRPTAIFINPHLTEPGEWSVIGQIKSAPHNRHIPIFTFSGQAELTEAVIHGAAGHLLLPLARSRLTLAFQQIERWQSQNDRMVLVVASEPQQATDQITAAIGIDRIRLLPTATAHEARKALETQPVDAVIVQSSTDDGEQQRFLKFWQDRPIPLILYAEKSAKKKFRPLFEPFTQLPDLKPIESPNQLLMTLLTFLHLSPDILDAPQRKRIEALESHSSPLKGRKILLVDDDMRTVFAVTSVLEDQGVNVYTGKTGKESLDKLDSFPDIDLILMDVMIAEVDGYQAIKNIRDRNHYQNIPILALTAKAMQGDRAKCIEAGADDYLSKPVNLDKLTSMLKIWLDPKLTKQKPVHR